MTVAILGEADLDVSKIELSSLDVHGAKPLRTEIRDVNGDGKPDLVAVFELARIKLNANAKLARLTGWLKNSQRFSGEQAVTVVAVMPAGACGR